MDFDALLDLVSASPWTYAVILAVAALDALVPLVPSETTVISAGVLAGAGDLQLGFVIVAGAAGAYAGDTSAFTLGRRFGPRLERRVFRGESGGRRRVWAERALERHGGPLIFGARFVPGGRTATTVTAGLLRMRWLRFLAFAGAAGVAWASYASLVGYLGGRAFEDNVLWGLLVGFGVAGATYVVVEVVRRARARLQRAAPPEPMQVATARRSEQADEKAA